MNSTLATPLELIGWIALALVVGYILYKVLSGVFWAFGRFFAGIGWFIRHVGQFIGGLITDVLHFIGGLVTIACYACAIVLNMLFGQHDKARHYGRALESELSALIPRLYRLVIGHVARLLLLSPVTEGVEQRLPQVVASEPPGRSPFATAQRPAVGAASAMPGASPGTASTTFAGYRVIGALQAGGSGARLFLAEPDAAKRNQLAAAGRAAPAQVVIKSFSLHDGSTLPQIVRENRALVAARDLGLVLEHELTASRFHYVMPYVPGEDLATVTARLHASPDAATGLDAAGLRLAVGYATDLLATLDRFHHAGLWHKDVKPGNIIVSAGHAQLVDLGLITPLRSAMTLTTHGTEYFRDPEMVRLALKGVKVHEVDGAKFDIYGAGAVLFSLLENGFPAHGSLSRLTRRCPEALALIVRRAMADMSHRYATARDMLADLQCLAAAPDPFTLRPADLPSLSGRPTDAALLAGEAGAASAAIAGAALPAAAAPGAGGASGARPATSMTPVTPVGGAAAPRAPAAGLDTDDETRGFFGRRHARRERRRLQRAERSERRSGSRGLLFVCILAGLFFSGHFMREQGIFGRRAVIERSSPPFRYSMETAGPRALDAIVGAPQAAPALSHADFHVMEAVSLDRLSQAEPPAAPVPAAAPLGTILVIDDLPPNTAPERRDAIDQLCGRLRAASWTLMGTAAATAAAGAGNETEVSLLAGARSAVGLADPADDEAIARLTAFLGDQGAALDAILWIGRGEGEQPVNVRAIARDQAVALRLGALLSG